MKRKNHKEWPPKTEPVYAKGKTGSAASLSRNKKGDIVAKKGKDFAGVSQATMKADAKTRAKTGDRTYTGAPAPQGGKQKVIAKSPNLKSASKKVIRQSRRKPTGSAQAKKSTKRLR